MNDLSSQDGPLEEEEDSIILAVRADPDTWMPVLVLGFKVEPDEIVDGHVFFELAPMTCDTLADSMHMASTYVEHLADDLGEMELDARKEVLDLYSQFQHSPDS